MYTSIRDYQVDPSNVAEIARRAESGFVPIISSVPGFVVYTLVDCGNGRVITTSFFDDQAGAEESVKKASSWVKENLGPLIPNPPKVTSGEVVVRKVTQGGTAGYGVMRRFQVDVSQIGEVTRRVQEELVPILSSVPGFVSYAAIDAGNGTAVTLSSFQDQASFEAAVRKAADWSQQMSSLLPTPPEVTTGKILFRKAR